MIELRIQHQFVHKHEAGQHIEIHETFEVGHIKHRRLKSVEVGLHLLHVQHRLPLREVRLLDVHRQAIAVRVEAVYLIVVSIQFEEHRSRLVIQVDAVVGQSRLLRKDIAAAVVTVHIEVHRYHIIGTCRTHHTGRLHGHGVTHHRAMLFLRYEVPVLALGQSEGLHRTGKLQSVRVLGIGVATPA